jgi:hypothetical protein
VTICKINRGVFLAFEGVFCLIFESLSRRKIVALAKF